MKDWNKLNRKMGGRRFNITSGAFGDTLVCGDQNKNESSLNTY